MLNYKNYRDFNYINALLIKNLQRIPNDIDLVVGIPRSGLIISTLVAEYKNLPSTDLYSFVNNIDNHKMANGSMAPSTDIKKSKKILLVDDAMGNGISMKNAMDFILKHKKVEILTFVIFVEPKSVNKVDIYCEQLEDQFLPWSILKRGTFDSLCDIDGVLCEDVPREFDDDGIKYQTFIKNSKPKFIPIRRINILVTGRLEKYRKITEDWLKQHNIQYNKLIMCPCNNNADRIKLNVGKWKAKIFKESNLQLFIESSFKEAEIIKNENPNKCVYCLDIANYM